jgi:DNA-binding FrmR family transcriptional regulator
MDAGGRATQEAKAERQRSNLGLFNRTRALCGNAAGAALRIGSERYCPETPKFLRAVRKALNGLKMASAKMTT